MSLLTDINEAKIDPIQFDDRDDAERFIDWLTKNGYDNYSLKDIKKDGGGWKIMVLQAYAHDSKKLHSKAIGMEKPKLDITPENVIQFSGNWSDILMQMGYPEEDISRRGPAGKKIQAILNQHVKDGKMRASSYPAEDDVYSPVKKVKESLLKELAVSNAPKNVQTQLKKSDASDAGASDVVDKAKAGNDISFSLMRNTINADGKVTGSDVTNYIERAEELNDEVDTIPFGLETDDGQIVKVYVNAEQADKFEEAMKNMLGMEDDIEEAINRLTTEFDIVDVVWPRSDDVEDGDEVDPDADLSIDDTSMLDGDPDDEDDFADDNYDVIAKIEDDETKQEKDSKKEVADGDEIAAAGAADDENPGDEEEELDADGKPVKKKKKKKKAAPPEPVEDEADVKEAVHVNHEADSASTAAAIKKMTSQGLHIKAMWEGPNNTVYIEDDNGDEFVMRNDKTLSKEKHGKKLTNYNKNKASLEENEQEKDMTFGSKFLERVLAEAAKEDRDGVKDGFNIPLDSQARALAAKLKLPFAKRLIAFMAMAGVPGRYLNTEDVENSIAGAADMLRKKVAVRRAFVAMYEGLANAKGYAPPQEAVVKESKAVVKEAEGRQKRGSFIQKLFETVLVELGLPEALVVTTGPSAVGTGIYRTAELIEQNSELERALRLLATRLGVKTSDAQKPVGEEKKDKRLSKLTALSEAADLGNTAYAQAVSKLVDSLGLPPALFEGGRETVARRAIMEKSRALRNRTQVITMIGRLQGLLDSASAGPAARQTAPAGEKEE